MKTQLVLLEPHDDLISIRDRMSWAKTPRILLIWPARGHVDVRPLDLALLQRHAETLGGELGLVTRNAEIRQAARQMGLPVFRTTKDAQRKVWPEHPPARPVRRFPKADLRAVRATLPAPEFSELIRQPVARVSVFALGVLAVLLVALIFLPSAKIRVVAPTQPQSLTIAVSADSSARQVQIAGVIPARATTLTLAVTESKLASGKALFADQPARGKVRFTNLTAGKVLIPAKTVLLTRTNPPLRFETVTQAEAPAGAGQTVEVGVVALLPGSDGNLPAEALTACEGPLGLTLAVTNPYSLTGGSDVAQPIPTEADRQVLRARARANLTSLARDQLPRQLASGDVFFPATFVLSQVLDETYDPAPDQPGQRLTLTLKAEFRANYASAMDLEALARLVLEASMPVGYAAMPDTLSITPVSALASDAEGVTHWQVRAERQLRQQIDPGQVIALAQGKAVKDVGSQLQQALGLDSVPEVNLQPPFWPWLPSLPFRITVEN